MLEILRRKLVLNSKNGEDGYLHFRRAQKAQGKSDVVLRRRTGQGPLSSEAGLDAIQGSAAYLGPHSLPTAKRLATRRRAIEKV